MSSNSLEDGKTKNRNPKGFGVRQKNKNPTFKTPATIKKSHYTVPMQSPKKPLYK